MQSLDRPPVREILSPVSLVTEEALIEAYLDRIPVEHRGAVRERLLHADKVVFAQTSDPEGQAILDRLYKLRRSD